MRFILVVLIFSFCLTSFAQSRKAKTIVKYEKRQKIDLGALLIDGELVSPGDFSIQDEKQRATEMLFKRKNHNDRVRINIEYVF